MWRIRFRGVGIYVKYTMTHWVVMAGEELLGRVLQIGEELKLF